jgi:hypothetical protein
MPNAHWRTVMRARNRALDLLPNLDPLHSENAGEDCPMLP